MKYIGVILLFWLNINQVGQDLYVCKNARITLFSSALIEDIKAVSTDGVSVYNPGTGELYFSVGISTFQFDKAFMQQHFNSDYMESDKYPKAIFKGQIQEHIDISKDGTYAVSAAGDLTVHGVSQKRTVRGSLIVKNGIITLSSEFMVKCADHHIDIPQILFYHIAENIKITVSATYSLYKINPSK
ncbi:YceI family protein [uncultured Mucilaginibacter sp.]|uniref:YceI family protein n=1 Tax=uncultured Mucilaginibacter sp. TaxID=797541 RepID=UPI0025FC0749|nr:YceI family protein [uncultured Mucilaginibacter sp.]